MDGYDFMRVIRDYPRFNAIPIVVVTGENTEESEKTCLELGAMDFMAKPCNIPVLERRISNLIGLREAREALADVEYDSLTGCYTREAFFHYAELLLHGNGQIPYTVFVTDIEDFKTINDRFGMPGGDRVLRRVADALRQGAGPMELVARYHGDRFVYLLPDAMLRDESNPVTTYLQLIRQELIPHYRITGKVGIYRSIDRSLSVNAICDRAVQALEKVKHQFGVFSAEFDRDLLQSQLRRTQIEESMQEAYEHGQFRVYYQPKHEARTGRLIGA